MKLYQKFTHPDMYLAAAWRDATGTCRAATSTSSARASTRWPTPAGCAAVLVQFPPSFHAEPETRDYLDWLLEALADYPLAVELRHRSWSDDRAATRALLAAHRRRWVLIDEPKFADSIEQDARAARVD